MSCVLTSGFNQASCKGGAGGIKRVLITEFANVSSFTQSSGTISAITVGTGRQFRAYVLDKEMGFFTDNGTSTVANGTYFYTPIIEFTIKGLTTAVRQELKLVAQNTLIMIVEDRSGVFYGFGFNTGMDLTTWSTESGTLMGDFKGQKLHFEGKDAEPVYEVQSSLITALLSPAV